MANISLLRQEIHDPTKRGDLVLHDQFKTFEGREIPVAIIDIPKDIDFKIENGAVKIYNSQNLDMPIKTICIFDTPLLSLARELDSFGVSFKFIKAQDAFLPAVFLHDFSTSKLESITVDASPYDLSLSVNENCFYAYSQITSIDKTIIDVTEQLGQQEMPGDYWNVTNGQLFTSKKYSEQVVTALVQTRITKAFLCLRPTRYMSMYSVLEECFDDSDTVRRAAISYNAKVRNPSR